MDEFSLSIPKAVENLQLPDPWLTNYWKLSEQRMFYIDSEIDETILELQRSIILINAEDKDIPVDERKPIKIFIDSPGGLLSEAFSVCQTIVMSKTPVYTYNIADAMSAAGLIFMAGHKRYAFPYSTVLIHSGSGGTVGTYEQTVEAQKQYKRQIDIMSEYILKQTKIDSALFKRNKTKDWYITADECIKYGVATDIISSFDEITG